MATRVSVARPKPNFGPHGAVAYQGQRVVIERRGKPWPRS